MIKHVEIINKQKRYLRGYLDLPKNACEIVVMFHGYTGNRMEHNGYFRTLSRQLALLNIASLRMDYSCNGESDGEFRDFSYREAIEDAKLMVDYAASIKQISKINLLGFSMGGSIAALLADYYPFNKILLWSPSGSLYEKLKERYEKSEKMSNGNIYSPGFEISARFIESMKDIDFYQNAHKFKGLVYIIHGRQDKAVDYLIGVTYAVKFPNSLLHIIDSAGHGYDDEKSYKELFSLSLKFLQEGFVKEK